MTAITDIPKKLKQFIGQEITVEFHYEKLLTSDDGISGADSEATGRTEYTLSGKLLAADERGLLLDKLKIKKIGSEEIEEDLESICKNIRTAEETFIDNLLHGLHGWEAINPIYLDISLSITYLEFGIERTENKNYRIPYIMTESARLKPFDLPARGEMATYFNQVHRISSIAIQDEKMISIDERANVTFQPSLLQGD